MAGDGAGRVHTVAGTSEGDAGWRERDDAAHRSVHGQFLGSPTSTGGEGPEAVWCTSRLADDVYWQAGAAHEAAHAVVGTAVGLPLVHATLEDDRSVRISGVVSFTGPGDAQLFAVWLAAGAVGQSRWLCTAGYGHPELHRCVRAIGGGADRAETERLAAQGFIVDLQRAHLDVSRLLGDPGLWAAVEQTAWLLLARRHLTSADVIAVLETHRITTQQVWTPDIGSADG